MITAETLVVLGRTPQLKVDWRVPDFSQMSDYTRYLLAEWEGYLADPTRFRASLGAVGQRGVSKVLDVGCGAGQELLPFVKDLGARGIGVDIMPEAIAVAQSQFAMVGCNERAEFICSSAESLPFDDKSFEVVVCRLALPYTRNAEALWEMARVLKTGGILILKIHHFRYYGRRLIRAFRSKRIREALSVGRIILNGMLYHLTGWQPNDGANAREVFQTRWMLRRTLRKASLEIREELKNSDSNRRTPIFVIEKVLPAVSSEMSTSGWRFWAKSWATETSLLASSFCSLAAGNAV